MRYGKAAVLVLGVLLIASLMGGCKKRYFPRITEEVIDEGVPVYSETVVE